MKISSSYNLSNSQEILRILKEDPKVASVAPRDSVSGSKQPKSDGLSGTDGQVTEKVSLSDHAKVANLIQDALTSVPEVRQDRVDAVKKELETGSYEVDPDKVAEAIVRELAVDSLLVQDFFK